MAKSDIAIGLKPLKKNHRRRWIITAVMAIILLIGVVVVASSVSWYQHNLTALNSKNNRKIRFTIKKGETTAQIGKSLESAGLIRSAQAFGLYIKFSRPDSSLQTGRYALSQSSSVKEIVSHLESGKTDLFLVTILPGATLADIRSQLQQKGYSPEEIGRAFSQQYSSPLLADKPPKASLEGYLFPETYEVSTDATLPSLFQRDFATLYQRLKKDDYIKAFKAHNLNLHQAITLASIVQQEASQPADQARIAQVFYARLKNDMKLESDPTFKFAARQLGVEPSIHLESPYNTRLHKGLPPGPISNTSYSALTAVARPAKGDDLYFVAGDDGTVYFSKTFQQHQAKIKKYCHKLCE